MSRRAGLPALALAALLGALPAPAAAQFGVTLYVGYVGTSGVDNVTSNTSASVKSSAAYAAALGWDLDPSRELQLFYSQQTTTLSPGGGALPFDLTVRYLHVGGTAFIEGPIDRGWYVVGGLGATQFSPSATGYGSEVKPSLNVGVGYYWPLGKNVALRAEGRGFFTLVNSSGGFMCSGGCIVVLRSETYLQYEAMLGLTARF